MKELSSESLHLLNETSSQPMVSLYLSKDDTIFDDKKCETRVNALLNKAEFLLLKDQARNIAEKVILKLKGAALADHFRKSNRSMAYFYSEGQFNDQIVFTPVENNINDFIIIADSFHVKPLIKISNTCRGYIVITMSSRAINVLIENQGHYARLDSFRNDNGVQSKAKQNTEAFFQEASQEINRIVAAYKIPVILAGVKDHIGHMKKLLASPFLSPNAVVGNVEKMKSVELRERVRQVAGEHFDSVESKSMSALKEAKGSEKLIEDLSLIAEKAVNGKIASLYVKENQFLWGRLNRQTGEINLYTKQQDSKDDDILDDLCQVVIGHGGEVVIYKENNSYINSLVVGIEK
jgi:hypothetical protein